MRLVEVLGRCSNSTGLELQHGQTGKLLPRVRHEVHGEPGVLERSLRLTHLGQRARQLRVGQGAAGHSRKHLFEEPARRHRLAVFQVCHRLVVSIEQAQAVLRVEVVALDLVRRDRIAQRLKPTQHGRVDRLAILRDFVAHHVVDVLLILHRQHPRVAHWFAAQEVVHRIRIVRQLVELWTRRLHVAMRRRAPAVKRRPAMIEARSQGLRVGTEMRRRRTGPETLQGAAVSVGEGLHASECQQRGSEIDKAHDVDHPFSRRNVRAHNHEGNMQRRLVETVGVGAIPMLTEALAVIRREHH